MRGAPTTLILGALYMLPSGRTARLLHAAGTSAAGECLFARVDARGHCRPGLSDTLMSRSNALRLPMLAAPVPTLRPPDPGEVALSQPEISHGVQRGLLTRPSAQARRA